MEEEKDRASMDSNHQDLMVDILLSGQLFCGSLGAHDKIRL